jgi:hypothetical protein
MFILEKGMDLPEIEEVGATAEHLVPGGQFGLSDNYVKIWPHALVPMLETDDGLRIGRWRSAASSRMNARSRT